MKALVSGFVLCTLLLLTSCDPPKVDGASDEGAGLNSIEELNAAIRANPNDVELYVKRADYHKATQDYNSAMRDMDRAVSLDSMRSDLHMEQGRLFYATGDVGHAQFALQRAIDLDPLNVGPKLEMAEIFFVLTNHDRAMSLINEALKIDDQLPKAYFLKGLIYREQKNQTLAKSSFQTVTELDPNHIEAFNLLGMIYSDEGDSLAVAFYRTALDIDSTNKEVLYNRAYYFQSQNRPEAALEAYDDLIRQHPTISAAAYHNKGYIYLGLMSEPEKAVSAFTEAIRLDPGYYQAYANRGVAHEELNRVELARTDYRKALELYPNFELAIQGLNRLD